MTYTVALTSRAARDLRHLPSDISRRIGAALRALEGNPRPPGCVKLTGADEWRIRVGDYRVRYTIDDPARRILITRIAHRREVYGP
jgi:mRNA interferase RelE/StbE